MSVRGPGAVGRDKVSDGNTKRTPRLEGPRAGTPKEFQEGLQRRFGKFELVRPLGSGGFGTVYLAHQSDLGRAVALKLMRCDAPDALRRFAREAHAAAKLSHPHIVPVYEIGAHNGRYYVAMEFIEGATLENLRIEPQKGLRIMHDVAAAVEYAHANGILHRDLKPGNLMLGRDGRVRVMDFGLARHLKGGTTLTVSGTVVGTPAYMSPEQAQGRRGDVRSDVYSLGATLYYLRTGHPPFSADTPLELLDRVRNGDVIPPRRYNPRVGRPVEAIVLKCLEKDPQKRYPNAEAFAEDLQRFLQGEPILARPSNMVTKGLRWAGRHRAVSAVSGVVLAGLAVLAVALLLNLARFRTRIRDLEARAKEAENRQDLRGAADL